MKTIKNKKGISLIVLVITIIVMIILAAAIIISISNSGIVNRANKAVEETNEKQIKELVSLAWAEAYLKDTTATKDDAYFYDEVIAYLKASGVTDEELAKYDITADKNGADANLKTAVLNEYGFYFEQLYMGTMEENPAGFSEIALVFHEDGSGEGFVKVEYLGNQYVCMLPYEAGSITYSENKITMTGDDPSSATISNNGMDLLGEFSGFAISATCSFGEYHGMYYDSEYIGTYTGTVNEQNIEAKYTLVVSANATATMKTEATINGQQQETTYTNVNLVDLEGNGYIFNIVNSSIESPTEEDKTGAFLTANGKAIGMQAPDDSAIILTLGGASVGGDSQTGETTDTEISHSGTIPEGGTYYVGVTSTTVGDYTGATATYTAGDAFPTTVSDGDVYVYGEYEYRYNMYWFIMWLTGSFDINGWNARVLDMNKTSYSQAITSINNKSVTGLIGTYLGCTSMPEAPVLPSTITHMNSAFEMCSALTTAPTIPNKVQRLKDAFADCTSLNTYVGSTDATGDFSDYVIPNSATEIIDMFSGCTSLTVTPNLSNNTNLLDMTAAFFECTNLTTISTLAPNVIDMSSVFSGCTSLTNEDISGLSIPSSVTIMYSTFSGCTGLTDVSGLIIPSAVTDVSSIFARCTGITDLSNFVIPANVVNMDLSFNGCTSLVSAPTIPSKVESMRWTFQDCTSLTGTVTINANPTEYNACFLRTEKSIVISGSCSSTTKTNLIGTANNGNVS